MDVKTVILGLNHMANNQVFVVRADSGIKTLADLAGQTVVVQVDSVLKQL